RGESRPESRPVAVGVLSYPVPSCAPREKFLGRTRFSRSENLRFANANIRTISRVIVHPQFRSIGLASALVRDLCARAGVRYVEAMAHMGRAHPLFERAGMTRIDPESDDKPIYFVFDSSPRRPREAT
ncbi:MAG: GNAT family N-acetyltransferase, partial [Tepidisphaeraceae bacterium]